MHTTKTRQNEEKHEIEISTLIERLKLTPHPEGGYYTDSYRSDINVSVPNYEGERHLGASIYYLLRNNDISAWHRMKQTEVFFWHAGGTLKINTINSNGDLRTVHLGNVLTNADCQFEAVIPPLTWMALEPDDTCHYVLTGAACFPGFEFEDWEMGKSDELKKQFPQHSVIIDRLCLKTS